VYTRFVLEILYFSFVLQSPNGTAVLIIVVLNKSMQECSPLEKMAHGLVVEIHVLNGKIDSV